MITSDTIVIRRAGAADVRVLARLAALDSAVIPGADSLIAERDGVAVAALDLTDGRVVADPFAPTARLAVHLRLRAEGLLAHEREPSLAARIRTALTPVAPRPQVA
jgi:hypothetical protein